MVTVGLQKRYAPCTQILKKKLNNETVISYNMRYCTGSYPEGHALLDLFIHPIDFVIYLFGAPIIVACEKIGKDSYITMLKHGDIVGTLELSTAYSWDSAIETLSVCTLRGVYNLSQMEELTFSSKPQSILGVPFEKVWRKNKNVEYLYSRNNFSPILSNNQIYSQGFYDEIKSFVDCVEANRISVTGFETLKETYGIIDNILKR